MKTSWQQLTFTLPDPFAFDAHPTMCDFWQMQPRLKQALKSYTHEFSQSSLMLICCQDHHFYRQQIAQLLQERDVHAAVIEQASPESLFGHHRYDRGQVLSEPGLLAQLHDGIAIMPASYFIHQPQAWDRMKALLSSKQLLPMVSGAHFGEMIQPELINLRLILTGDRYQLAEFEQLEPDSNSAEFNYGEVEADIAISAQSLPCFHQYLRTLAQSANLPYFADHTALEAYLRLGARQCENQGYQPLSPLWHQAWLSRCAIQSEGLLIEAKHVTKALAQKINQESYLPLRAQQDIKSGHVHIDCENEAIGQINGLTVIDIAGHPRAYGEPSRISCVVHCGDGDISDVERKVELGGNIHAKGMMIMEAFVSAALNLDQPLPFSASIVFEQSYCEVDGDSASLAEFCALVSALSQTPLTQQIAVTGAMDQFGRVQAVGGVNEKIESFFAICQHRGLTGSQGVILPRSNLENLVLSQELIEAIQNEQFHLWSVEYVEQALLQLTGCHFAEGDDCLLEKIALRIDMLNQTDSHQSCWSRLKNWFVHS